MFDVDRDPYVAAHHLRISMQPVSKRIRVIQPYVNFNDLPDDILCLILSNLDQSSQIRLRRVSRRMLSVADSTISSLHFQFRHSTTPKKALALVVKCTSLTMLRIENISVDFNVDAFLTTVFAACPSLHKFVFVWSAGFLSSNVALNLCDLKQLRILGLRGIFPLTEILDACLQLPLLESLSLKLPAYYVAAISRKPVLFELLARLRRITIVGSIHRVTVPSPFPQTLHHLEGLDMACLDDCDNLLESAPNLRYLRCKRITREICLEQLYALAICTELPAKFRAPNLEYLYFSSQGMGYQEYSISTDTVIHLADSGFDKLRCVSFGNNSIISHESLEYLCSRCPELSSVRFTRFDTYHNQLAPQLSQLTALELSTSDTGLRHISRICTRLRVLDICCDSWKSVSNDGLFEIAQHCQQLTHLGFSSSRVSNEGLLAVAKHLPFLQVLDMRNCDRVTADGIRNAAHHLSDLRIVIIELPSNSLQLLHRWLPRLEIKSARRRSLAKMAGIQWTLKWDHEL